MTGFLFPNWRSWISVFPTKPLERWFSTFIMLQPFTTVSHTVVTSTVTLFPCYLRSSMSHQTNPVQPSLNTALGCLHYFLGTKFLTRSALEDVPCAAVGEVTLCDFAAVMNCNENVLYAGYLLRNRCGGCDPQVRNHCFRGTIPFRWAQAQLNF